jgi:hypothetical protein
MTVVLVLAVGCGENLTPPPGPSGDANLTCVPDLDGKIVAAELAPTLETESRYFVGRDRAVDLVGVVDSGGRRSWDFSVSRADDQILSLTAHALGTQWYAGSFPGGQFVTAIDATTDGIYAEDALALSLLGVASTVENPPAGKTLIVYDQPVALLRFPLQAGARWTSVGDISGGTIRGLPYLGRDTYDVVVDGAGRMALPDATFTQALRVRTQVTVAPSIGAAVTRRQVGFYFECFGEIARATSRDGETSADFTTASELRRLAF